MNRNGFAMSRGQLISFIKKIDFEKLVKEVKEYIESR
jgi:hypothetical protein